MSVSSMSAVAGATAAPGESRLAAATVRSVPISVSCPSWCVVDHAAFDLRFLEDLSHWGAPVALPAPVFGGAERVLIARVVQSPFSPAVEGREPRVLLEATDDSDPVRLDVAGVEAVAASLEEHARVLRAMAGAL